MHLSHHALRLTLPLCNMQLYMVDTVTGFWNHLEGVQDSKWASGPIAEVLLHTSCSLMHA